jgi:hypothetical protein
MYFHHIWKVGNEPTDMIGHSTEPTQWFPNDLRRQDNLSSGVIYLWSKSGYIHFPDGITLAVVVVLHFWTRAWGRMHVYITNQLECDPVGVTMNQIYIS